RKTFRLRRAPLFSGTLASGDASYATRTPLRLSCFKAHGKPSSRTIAWGENRSGERICSDLKSIRRVVITETAERARNSVTSLRETHQETGVIAGAGLKWGDQILQEIAMFGFRKEIRMPLPSEALPGRSTPLPTAERHFVNGKPLKGPFPEGLETALFGLGCFWRGIRQALRRTRPMRRRARASRAIMKWFWSCLIPISFPTRRFCGSSGRAMTRRKACGKAMMSGRLIVPEFTHMVISSALQLRRQRLTMLASLQRLVMAPSPRRLFPPKRFIMRKPTTSNISLKIRMAIVASGVPALIVLSASVLSPPNITLFVAEGFIDD
ncbi:MAG: hypothetical protein RL543_1349, partial [Pseudomonadota bacterium]